MEDFLKFLLIAGVILVGIFKEVNKNNKSKKAQNKRPVSPMPSPVEVAPDAVPMPVGEAPSLEELLQPKPMKQTPPQQSPKQTPKPAAQQKRKKEEISVAASIANSSAQDKRNSQQGSHYNSHTESTDNEHDFTIHSAEEAAALLSGERYFNGSIERARKLIEFRIIM